jgi:hypothetical protein
MDSIQTNSSSQQEPVGTATNEYDEITALPKEGPVEVRQRRISNEREPIYPPSHEAETVKEVIYAEPLVQKQDKHPITASQSEEPAQYAVPMPEQFKDYSDDELELLATVLNKTLKERQGQMDQEIDYRNKPNETDVEFAPKLDTILEDPVPDTGADYLATEVPPPIPIKKRRQRNEGTNPDVGAIMKRQMKLLVSG